MEKRRIIPFKRKIIYLGTLNIHLGQINRVF
jgi:hypothetical protein